MIYYFSATGNSKYVAEGIAGALGDEAQSIQRCDGPYLGRTFSASSRTPGFTIQQVAGASSWTRSLT